MRQMTDSPWPGMQIEEEIGYGSFGTVYRVLWEGRTYALKQILIPCEDNPDANDIENSIIDPFLREIRILRRFTDNPNIVSLKDDKITKTDQGYVLSILMECLEPFSEYETTHQVDEAEVIRLGIDLCHALDACEKEGILHRDLKLDNILVSPDGTFKLCDFGEAGNLEKTITDGSVKGTFAFMAPEVYHGKKYDKRADIYSLGMILYRCLGNESLVYNTPSQTLQLHYLCMWIQSCEV